jgi:hypothetical protein
MKRICELINAGNYIEVACASVGIGKTTYYKWLELAEAREGLYREFRDAVEAASAKAEVAAVKQIRAENTPEQMRWFLERRFPERWGRAQPREPLNPELKNESCSPRINFIAQLPTGEEKFVDSAALAAIYKFPTVKRAEITDNGDLQDPGAEHQLP